MHREELVAALVFVMVSFAGAGPARGAGGIIMNTLQGFDDHEAGWSGSADALYSGSGGNTARIIAAGSGRVQWRGDRNRWQFRAAFGYEESGGSETARNATLHLRHNFDLRAGLATIAFIQVQENPFQRLESRWLAGVGLRGDIIDDDKTTLLVGATPMLELERLEGSDDRGRRGRLSVFLFLARQLNEKVELDASGFAQPLFKDFRNIRTSGTLALVVSLAEALDVKLGAAIETNSNPAPGVEKNDWTTFASVAFKF